METKWYRNSYRRHLLDMHYEDWDESFLSSFEPKTHVEMLKRAKVKSAVIFTNSHTGLAYWPQARVPMHKGIHGRDIVGETVELFLREGIDPILYMSFIYDNWAYENHPEWRIMDANGQTSREWAEGHRYGLCCPNSPYRGFAFAQTAELCGRYPAVSFHPDMLFWNAICFCPHCRERFRREVGGEIPAVVDWNGERWTAFQRKREEWLTEFARSVCAAARQARPGMTVSVQSSSAISSWYRGYTETEIQGCDYSYGDLYGGLREESFACKFYHDFSPNLPFQYETNSCDVDWTEHTIRKPVDFIEMQAFTAIAHNGAFLFIEPIGPDGRHQNAAVFAEMGGVFSRIEQVEPWLGGTLCGDVGIYLSLRANHNPDENGMSVTERPHHGIPHLAAAMGAASILSSGHIPYGVTNRNALAGLDRYQALVLPDVLYLDQDEAEAVRGYVAGGGNLYASGRTFHPALAELLGIRLLGETKEPVTYVNNVKGNEFMPATFSGYPLTIRGRQALAEPMDRHEVMAVVNLPLTDPNDRGRFVSIHSNPPGRDSEYPAVVCRQYGKGRVVWCSAAIEAMPYMPHREIFLGLVKKLLAKPAAFESDAPAAVEIVLLHQRERRFYLMSLLNLQEQMPPLPIYSFTVRVNLSGNAPKSILNLPGRTPLAYTATGGVVEFAIDRLDLYRMIGISY
jgi:hypothetical protein